MNPDKPPVIFLESKPWTMTVPSALALRDRQV